MSRLASGWDRLRIQQKVWVILLLVSIPLAAAFGTHILFINHLHSLQLQRHQVELAREQVNILRRLVVDIEDAFRGYLLTRQDAFLNPLKEAEPRLRPTLDEIIRLAGEIPNLQANIQDIDYRVQRLLISKHKLLKQFRAGHSQEVFRYVQSGQGIALSDELRSHLRLLEDRLVQQLQNIETKQASIVQVSIWGLMLALLAVIGLALTAARLFAHSITSPVSRLQQALKTFGMSPAEETTLRTITVHSSDEIGELARCYQDMADRIDQQIREMEAISVIGNEINTIRPDGVEGVLYRITNLAADLLHVDICLVMLRNEKMGCWVVEAASGEWNDRLCKTVMLWEEFPVSVQAFETNQPVIGEALRRDSRPEVMRRNLIGESMLSIPLLSQGVPFGVLVLLLERKVPREAWNVKLAKGFADEAAVAIANARLYETSQQKGKEVRTRIRELQYLAETLAHDLRAPGERVEALATLLRQESGGQLSDQAIRRLRLIEENGKELRMRVEHILTVARVGSQGTAVEAVDPAMIIHDVMKQRAGELERARVSVDVQDGMPLVACHAAYLRQVFDNLMSNAIKFLGNQASPLIQISYERRGELVYFTMSDNGSGIPPEHRERVFAPFVRLNPDVTPGSGIGLTIVRRIIEQYGGQVWIESSPTGGCSVIFSMPVLGDLRRDSGEHPIVSTDPIQWAYGGL